MCQEFLFIIKKKWFLKYVQEQKLKRFKTSMPIDESDNLNVRHCRSVQKKKTFNDFIFQTVSRGYNIPQEVLRRVI